MTRKDYKNKRGKTFGNMREFCVRNKLRGQTPREWEGGGADIQR